MARFYEEFADWWPLLSAPEDYSEEADLYARVITELAERPVHEVLEFGSGGGNNASHMKSRFSMTLVDPSPGMLEVSRSLNPECGHVLGDMRSVRLERAFDAVFVHDAVMYMTTLADLRAAVETARAHLYPGGVAVFVPDETTETFEATTDHGGHDGPDGRALRYLEWSHPPDPGETSYRMSFVFVMKDADGRIRTEYDEHRFGLFPRATWLDTLEWAGMRASAIRHSYGGSTGTGTRELFAGVRSV